LDKVRAKLIGDNTSAFYRLIYSLVRTDQMECAETLDEEKARNFKQKQLEKNPRHG